MRRARIYCSSIIRRHAILGSCCQLHPRGSLRLKLSINMMIVRKSLTGLRTSILLPKNARCLSSTPTLRAKNRIYPSRIRREDELETLKLMSASSRVPLITLWMAVWCQSCKIVSPMIQELIENEGIGEDQGGVSFVEVEMDSTLRLPFSS